MAQITVDYQPTYIIMRIIIITIIIFKEPGLKVREVGYRTCCTFKSRYPTDSRDIQLKSDGL